MEGGLEDDCALDEPVERNEAGRLLSSLMRWVLSFCRNLSVRFLSQSGGKGIDARFGREEGLPEDMLNVMWSD